MSPWVCWLLSLFWQQIKEKSEFRELNSNMNHRRGMEPANVLLWWAGQWRRRCRTCTSVTWRWPTWSMWPSCPSSSTSGRAVAIGSLAVRCAASSPPWTTATRWRVQRWWPLSVWTGESCSDSHFRCCGYEELPFVWNAVAISSVSF